MSMSMKFGCYFVMCSRDFYKSIHDLLFALVVLNNSSV